MIEKDRFAQVLMHIFMIILVLICVVPFFLMLISSLSSEQSLQIRGYSFVPMEWSTESYQYLLSRGTVIGRAYIITIVTTAVGTVASLLITFMYAYPLSRPEMKFRGLLTLFTFLTMIFNGGMIPTYLMYTQQLHIKNTFFAMIIPGYLMSAFNVMLMRSYLRTNIPDSLIEAARIDGAGELRIAFRIVFPLCTPMIATLALMVGLGYWNDWINSVYYISEMNLFSIQRILNQMLTNIEFLAQAAEMAGSHTIKLPSIGIRMAIAVVSVLPILVIYAFLQKYFVKGIVIGGVKG